MTDKAREEFEAWAKTQDWNIDFMWHDGYDAWETKFAFDAWQASRAALVIELPAENPLGSGTGDHGDGRPSFEQHCAAECNFVLRDCREAIEAAGLKVKP